MLGLDKLFGKGLLGSFFDSIGMPWMNNLISLAANIATGNWLEAAREVFNLVSQFSNSWQDQVATRQPLGAFDNQGCFGRPQLTSARTSDWSARLPAADRARSGRAAGAFAEINDTLAAREALAVTRQSVVFASRA